MPNLTDLPLQAVAKAQQYVERGSAELHYARKMFEAGAFKIEPPQNIAAMLADIRRWGEFGMIPALNARRTPNADRRHRRRRRDDVQRTRRRRQRRRQRAARDGRQGRRRRRAADPQPPLVPGRAVRRRPDRCPADPAQQRVLRSADQRGVRARRREAHHLRRRVHRGGVEGRAAAGQAAGAGHQPRQGRAVGKHRRDAGRPDRAQQQGSRPRRRPSTRRSSS